MNTFQERTRAYLKSKLKWDSCELGTYWARINIFSNNKFDYRTITVRESKECRKYHAQRLVMEAWDKLKRGGLA